VRTGLGILIVDFAVQRRNSPSVEATARRRSRPTAPAIPLLHARRRFARVPSHFSSGATDTLYDFLFGIARDVSVATGKLAAIVGGAVSYTVDSILGDRSPTMAVRCF